MTREQAIRFAKKAQTMTEIQEVSEFYRMAERALRAQDQNAKLNRSRWKGCEYCIDQQPYCDCVLPDGTDQILCSKGESFIDGFQINVRKIKFCPMCGKPMTEDAWTELERRIENNGKID